MAVFGSGKRPPRGDSSKKSFKLKMAKYLDKKELRCVTVRDSEGVETIISHGAVFSSKKGILGIINDSGECIFACEATAMNVGELLSLEGAVITAFDLKTEEIITVVAYYKYWRQIEKDS